MGYDYNTQRNKLHMPEYGRNVQKMVEHVLTLENREERNKAAQALVNVMGNLAPHLRDVNDFKHKLWDHLAIISEFSLDIDAPYPMPTRAKLSEKPRRVPYNQQDIKYKHYGKVLSDMIKKATEMEDGVEKKVLTEILANLLKKFYLTWNRESVTDTAIFGDLRELSKGLINITEEEMKLSETRDILFKNKKNRPPLRNKGKMKR